MLLLYCYYPRSVNLMTLSNAGLFSHTFVILQKLLVAKKGILCCCLKLTRENFMVKLIVD